jgi:4-hydroxy-3-methylbut-2-enyl diphosphate reductase
LLVESVGQVETLEIEDADNLAFVTQTTLSVDDTADIVAALQRRFPGIEAPRKEDICYATTNRQAAVKHMTPDCDAFVVLGAPNSSNSNRLAEVARAAGCPKAMLIERAAELDFAWLDGVTSLGVTAGASAPELLVQELIAALNARFDVTVREITVATEDVRFSLPRALTT